MDAMDALDDPMVKHPMHPFKILLDTLDTMMDAMDTNKRVLWVSYQYKILLKGLCSTLSLSRNEVQ
jgi:hypothetical protein